MLAAQGKVDRYRASRGKATATAVSECPRCLVETTLQAPSPTASLIGHSLGEAFREVWEEARLVA